jgi:CheY-like chemotaxis protein
VATILVVDDEQNNRLLVRTVAQYAGYDVLEAHSGEDALSIAADVTQPVNLVLLDLSLPTMSGTEFVRRLRADARTRSVPVLLYTATEPNAALRDFMRIYSVTGIVRKPAEAQDLLAALERALPQ